MEKEKLKFCFYCGALLPRYKEGETKYCVYCGVELPYKTKLQIQKPNN